MNSAITQGQHKRKLTGPNVKSLLKGRGIPKYSMTIGGSNKRKPANISNLTVEDSQDDITIKKNVSIMEPNMS